MDISQILQTKLSKTNYITILYIEKNQMSHFTIEGGHLILNLKKRRDGRRRRQSLFIIHFKLILKEITLV